MKKDEKTIDFIRIVSDYFTSNPNATELVISAGAMFLKLGVGGSKGYEYINSWSDSGYLVNNHGKLTIRREEFMKWSKVFLEVLEQERTAMNMFNNGEYEKLVKHKEYLTNSIARQKSEIDRLQREINVLEPKSLELSKQENVLQDKYNELEDKKLQSERKYVDEEDEDWYDDD